MAQCRVCGNKIELAVTILVDGTQQEFDCVSCAKEALVPACLHCGYLLKDKIGDPQHVYYCCEKCAEGCEISTEVL